jgi:hypothetical protein
MALALRAHFVRPNRQSCRFVEHGFSSRSHPPSNIKRGPLRGPLFIFGGERGIRTPGRFPVNGFQDRRFRPLSQLSNEIKLCAHLYPGESVGTRRVALPRRCFGAQLAAFPDGVNVTIITGVECPLKQGYSSPVQARRAMILNRSLLCQSANSRFDPYIGGTYTPP